MKIKILIHGVILTGMLIMFSPYSIIRSQESMNPATEKQDSLVNTWKTSPHSLFTGVGYGNNMVYMGASISQERAFYSGSLTYGFKNEFYASLSVYHLTSVDPYLAFQALSLFYNHEFNSWFDISIGIYGYQVAHDLIDTLFNSFLYGNLALGFDWNILYTNLSLGGVFSETSNAYLQVRNSRYFQTKEILNGSAFFSFDPYANMLFGTLTETKTDEGTSIGISPPFRPGKSSATHSSGATSTIFSLVEIDFGVPVSFSMGRLTLEAEPGYILPFYSETDILNPKGFIFTLSCYFRTL